MKPTNCLCRAYSLHRATFFLILLLAIPLGACSWVGRKPTPVVRPPTVAITSPATGQTVPADENVPVNSTANDTQGVVKVELWVDGQLYRVDPSSDPEGQRTFVVSQLWRASPPGSHTLVIKAYNLSGQVGESVPVAIDVVPSVASVPTDTPTLALPTGTPTVTDTPAPPPPTDTPVPLQPTDTPRPTDTPLPIPPVVKILVPQGSVTVGEGVDLTIRVRATGDQGIARLELWADGAVYEGHEVSGPGEATLIEVDLTWRSGGLGDHVLEVRAFDTASQVSQPAVLDVKVVAELPAVAQPFAHVWAVGEVSGRLGSPVAEAVLDRWVADQLFESGLTYWRNNESSPANYVYVLLYGDGTDETQGTVWLRFEDVWHEGMPELACPEAGDDLGPKRGFGKIWCEEATVRDGLGLPVTVEQGAEAGFQDFEGGTMLWAARLGYIYVLYDGGGWQRFSARP